MSALTRRLAISLALGTVATVGCNKDGDTAEAGKAAGSAGAKAAGSAGAAAGAGGATTGAASAQGQALLARIPSDTPYAFVNTEPVPKAALEKIFTALKPVLDMADGEITKVLAEPMGEGTEEKVGRAILEEFKGNLNLAGLEKMGISTTPRVALYGVGVLPVMRFELANPEALKALVGRIETKAGVKVPTAKFGEQDYYKISEDGVTAAIAVVGNELVFTAGPDAAMPKVLPLAFGQTAPAANLATSGAIAKLNAEHGFLANGSGYLDLNTIAATVLGEGTGLNAEIWQAVGAPPVPLDATCKKEIRAMVAKGPRLVFGYTRLDANQWNLKYVAELDAGLAGQLAALSAAVPGLGNGGKSLLSFGMGLDIPKTVAFAKAQLKALQDAPFQCAEMAEMNEGVTMAAAALASQEIPELLSGIKGFHVTIDDGQFGAGMPTGVKGLMVIAADKPSELLIMGQGMVPPLANFKLAADGKPVALPAGILPPEVEAPHAAMTAGALAISVGTGYADKLAAALAAPAATNPPIIAGGYDVSKFMKIMGDQPGMDSEEKQILAVIGNMLGHVSYSLSFTPKGVELAQQMSLN
jgi:hypothetical protein